MRSTLLAGLGTKGLRLLHLAWLVSGCGTWTYFLALAVYAYQEAGAVGVGLAGVARMLPAGLLAPLSGPLVDRLPRRSVLVVTLLLQAPLAAGTALLVQLDARSPSSSSWRRA